MSYSRQGSSNEYFQQGHRPSNSITSNTSNRNERDNRRDTVSSTGSGRSVRQKPALESTVTRLLVSIKQLLESLQLWSNRQVSEQQVSDVYVQLGNDFNAAVAVFESYGIDMSELNSVPEDLRDVLERCLAEDANPANLEIYLPQVRRIIKNLLEGLPAKQALYRARVKEREKERQSRSTTRQESSYSEDPTGPPSSGAEEPRPPSRPNGNTSASGSGSGRRTPSGAVSDSGVRHPSGRRRHGDGPSSSLSRTAAWASDGERRAASYSSARGSTDIPVPPIPQDNRPPSRSAGLPRSPSQRRTGSSRVATTGGDSDNEGHGRSQSMRMHRQPSNLSTVSLPPEEDPAPPTPPVPSIAQIIVPPEVKRYSLSDKPAPVISIEVENPTPQGSPDVQLDLSTPPPETPGTPGVESSLAALKKSDALERRASKRWSVYTLNKFTEGSGGRSGGSNSLNAGGGSRRSVAAGSLLTTSDLAALTEQDEDGKGGAEGTESPSRPKSRSLARQRSLERRRRLALAQEEGQGGTPQDEPFTPPVPSLPTGVNNSKPTTSNAETTSKDALSESQSSSPVNGDTSITKRTPLPDVAEESEPSTPSLSRTIQVFLQVGRQVKKTSIDPNGLSFGALRIVFMDKFSYNPGQDNFPSIYIRDPSSGVQYELEDVSEVKEKCLLSLNIEPLDQLKQHLDGQLLAITQEIKDIKTTVAQSRRMSLPMAAAQVMQMQQQSNPTLMSRPSEKQFQSIAQRITKMQQPPPAASPLVPQITGATDMTNVSPRILTDLKTQFDEVQNIRRDLGVMRQIYVEFVQNTKDSLGALKNQATAVRQLANTKVGGARASIDSGKSKLDKRSQTVLTEIEDLQDTIENLKDDVIKRQIKPKPDVLKRVKAKIAATAEELESLRSHVSVIKPSWKKTWEDELQNIVDEQQFLTHQEELLNDLAEDHKAVSEVWTHLEKVVSIRGNSGGSKAGGDGPFGSRLKPVFRPPPQEEGFDGRSTVLLEIRGAQVDPEKRLKAIEASQRNRKREMEMRRGDEFEKELKGFVDNKKLKKTGGAEEAERVRQRKNDLAFKAMFSNGPGPSFGGGSPSGANGGGGFGFGGGSLPGLATAPPMDDDDDDVEDGDDGFMMLQ